MYNFSAHTLNGVAVSYSSLPNFALDIIERDERLTLASKLIYMRLLRYASMIKQTAFKITGSWLVQNVVIDRRTVSRSIVQLKQYGYMTDKGIVIPDNMTGVKQPTHAPVKTEKAPQVDTIKAAQATPELTTNKHNAADMLRALVGIRKAKASQDDDVAMGQNVPLNGTNCDIDKKTMGQNVPLNGTNCDIEWDKMCHPIKNKEKNKEKNKPTPEKADTAQTPGPVKTTAPTPTPTPAKSDTTNTRYENTTATKLSVFIKRSHLGGHDDCLKTKPNLGGGDAGNYDSTFKGYSAAGNASANTVMGVQHV